MSQSGVGAATGLSFKLGVPSAIAEAELAISRAKAVSVVSLRMSISQVGVAVPPPLGSNYTRIAAPISKRAPLNDLESPPRASCPAPSNLDSLGELSPPKTLIRNADTVLLTSSPAIVVNLQPSAEIDANLA